MNATIPFSILEMLIAHQTPVMPSPIAVNPIAIGIRAVDAKENASCLISGLFGYDQ